MFDLLKQRIHGETFDFFVILHQSGQTKKGPPEISRGPRTEGHGMPCPYSNNLTQATCLFGSVQHSLVKLPHPVGILGQVPAWIRCLDHVEIVCVNRLRIVARPMALVDCLSMISNQPLNPVFPKKALSLCTAPGLHRHYSSLWMITSKRSRR